MLKLSEMQIDQLDHLEKRQYLAEVCKNIISDFPEFAADQSLADRLERAYKHAVNLGFKDGPAITQFIYYDAFAPDFYCQPAIHAWLTKPGQNVEQRFSDLNAQMKSKFKEI